MDENEALTVSPDAEDGALAPSGAAAQERGRAPAHRARAARAAPRARSRSTVDDAAEDLIEGGVLDSLALVELLFELERRFDVRARRRRARASRASAPSTASRSSSRNGPRHVDDARGAARVRPEQRRRPDPASHARRPTGGGGVSTSSSRAPARGRLHPGSLAHFARTFLDHPWADPEIPSLVCEAADGRICGFIGCHVRGSSSTAAPIRVACGGQLVTDPDRAQPSRRLLPASRVPGREAGSRDHGHRRRRDACDVDRIGGQLAPWSRSAGSGCSVPCHSRSDHLLTRTAPGRRAAAFSGLSARLARSRRPDGWHRAPARRARGAAVGDRRVAASPCRLRRDVSRVAVRRAGGGRSRAGR